MPPQRTRQACAACTRRKVRCSKTTPCTNCVRRGESDCCSQNSASVSSGGSSKSPRTDGNQEELQRLRNRVAELEAEISKAQPETSPNRLRAENRQAATSLSRPNDREDDRSHDGVIQDAASILEFLAWGRRKNPDYHSIASPSSAIATVQGPVRDIQDLKYETPGSIDRAFLPFGENMDAMPRLSTLQMLLPGRKQTWKLINYHIECLLWFHISFHAPTFCSQVEQFFDTYHGSIKTGVNLQWVALLFAVLTGSITCAPRHVAQAWGFHDAERSVLSRRWFRAVITCLNEAEYTANLSILSVQAISTMTISAHLLGFSNMQSIQLAAAVRIAQSLGLHRISDNDSEKVPNAAQSTVEKETGRRLWLQLCSQDWFGIPFSESYLVNPLYSHSDPPMNCYDEGENSMQPLPESTPTTTSYCRFLSTIASIMPQLQDNLLLRNTAYTRYEQVLASDKRLRSLAMAERPPFLTNIPLDPSWPAWVAWSRHAIALSSAHKIIMIHRAFLSESFTDPAFVFTRRTCIAASKTIVKEFKCVDEEDGPILWVSEAFPVAASIILLLDILHRDPSEREYTEHLQLVVETVDILRHRIASMIAVRGVKLLSALLVEVDRFRCSPAGDNRQSRGLDVPAFVRSFCDSLSPACPTSAQTSNCLDPQIPGQQQPFSESTTLPGIQGQSSDSSETMIFDNRVSESGRDASGSTSGGSPETTGFPDIGDRLNSGLGMGFAPSAPLLHDAFNLPPGLEGGTTFENLLYLANHEFSIP